MRDRERERTQTVAEKVPRQTNKQNTLLCLVMGGWHTNGPVVIGKYIQTRQRRLRAKIIKFGHSRHYKKKTLAVNKREETGGTITKE